ncbi:MAG: amphi-Trp domain-containing protein [Rhodospirillales bacterium]|uniref:amphi-Trp domain-containing protein n=1 Tax=Thalassospira lucentensis TaxID=168935 RepID=UPI003D2EB8BA|nr:amphi-Trp domain-containing protein [Rhodospirillales bacterium]
MKQIKKKFRHDSLQDADSIKAILKAITTGLGKGKVVLSDDQDEIILKPEGLLNLKVSASQDEDRSSLTLRVSWHADRDVPKNRKLVVGETK